MAAMEQRLFNEMARYTNAIGEMLSRQVAVGDEKYANLPARVGRLESSVYKRTRQR